MGVKVKDTNRIPRVMKQVSGGVRLDLGIFGENADKKAKGTDITLGGLAEVHEFGVTIEVTEKMRNFLHYKGIHLKKSTTSITIPERSFLRSGWDENGDELVKKLEKLFLQAFQKGTDLDRLTDALGLEAKGKLQKYARNLSRPANHPATQDSKGSSNPLVDTGAMIGAIDYKATRKKVPKK